VVSAEGPFLEQILDASFDLWNDGLSRVGYGAWYVAQLKTAWGRTHLKRFALAAGDEVLTSAKQYELDAELDGQRVRVLGIGGVFTQPAHRGRGHARVLIDRLLEQSALDGFDAALLFSEIGADYYRGAGFEVLPTDDVILRVVESRRYGAPATMVRAGDERDLAPIAAMGRARSAACRFFLTRDAEFIQYAVTKKRLHSGLGRAGARDVAFFIAEEGAAAAAYVVIVARGDEWILEECGDRDPGGARVGAILQALIAREPSERRRVIRGWLPPGFLPPQVTIAERRPSSEVMMVRPVSRAGEAILTLSAGDILYWHGDLF
jgi:predicted N-acetyltransferase YhbS